MSPKLRLRPLLVLTKTKLKPGFALSVLMLVSTSCLTQQSTAEANSHSQDSQNQDAVASASPARDATTITVPAGVRIALVLMHPIQSRYVHRGDDIYAQTTSPVVAQNEVVIPPGTFVQGKVDKLARTGGRAELWLQSMSITYPDGYVAPIAGPMTVESGDGYAIKDPGKGRIIGAFALPAAGLGLGTLIGYSLTSSQGSTINTSLPPSCGVPNARMHEQYFQLHPSTRPSKRYGHWGRRRLGSGRHRFTRAALQLPQFFSGRRRACRSGVTTSVFC
jgi:hypothetical protein